MAMNMNERVKKIFMVSGLQKLIRTDLVRKEWDMQD